jgi:hypothetical protein
MKAVIAPVRWDPRILQPPIITTSFDTSASILEVVRALWFVYRSLRGWRPDWLCRPSRANACSKVIAGALGGW